jgi:PAS domain S-box-containing protein
MRTQAVGKTTRTDSKEQTTDLLRLCRYTTEYSPLPLVVAEGSAHIVQYANPAFCALCGKTSEELIGRSYAEVVQEGTENGSLALLDRVYHTGETETLPDQQHASYGDHQAYWSYTVWAMYDDQGHPTEVIIQVTDTTESATDRQGLGAINQALLLSGVRQHEQAATT